MSTVDGGVKVANNDGKTQVSSPKVTIRNTNADSVGSRVYIPTSLRVKMLRQLLKALETHFRCSSHNSGNNGEGTVAHHSQVSLSLCQTLDRYIHSLESEVFLFFGSSGINRYISKGNDLCYHLLLNGSFLCSKYRPRQMIFLSRDALVEKTFIAKKAEEEKDRKAQMIKALDHQGLFKEFETDTSLAYCPKCKSTNITFKVAQVRGADEGQTVFFTCQIQSCANTWTLNT